jgi:hypothetical protein
LHEPLALLVADRPSPCHGRRDQAPRDDFGVALGVEHRDEGFAAGQLGDRGGGVEGGVPAEHFRRRLDRLLVARRKGAQGMLNPIAELSQNSLRHVGRILGDEINADGDEADNLLDRAQKVFRRIAEQKMRFVEKESQLWLVARCTK